MITTSAQMSRMLRHRRIASPGPLLALDQPLPAAIHAVSKVEHRFTGSIVFTGRSDFLFSPDSRMAKDALR